MIFLPDVNVWLALSFQRHEHHSTATNWFDAVPEASCAFCRLTQQGFLRLATNPKAFGKDTATLENAWQMYDDFRADPRVVFCEEPDDLEIFWRKHTKRRSFSPKLWSDAYLAAFAAGAAFELVTFDRGIAVYKGIRITVLS